MRRRWLVVAGVVVAVGVAVWARPLLRRLEFFAVRRVEVLGARYLSGDDVLAAMALPEGASVVDPTVPIEDRVREIVGVRDARVSRRWPGTLVVRLVEGQPVALTPKDGGLALLDARGRILPFDPTRRPADLPIAPADSAVAALLGRLREVEPGLYAEVVSARRMRGDVVLEAGGRRYLMRADATADELRALAAVAGDLLRKGRTYRELDARFAERILVRGMRS